MTYKICDSQAFANQRGFAFELLDDAPAFDLRRGDWLAIKQASRYACDALHVLRSGEVVQMQGAVGGVRLTRGDGTEEIITVDETRRMVLGYVMEELARRRLKT